MAPPIENICASSKSYTRYAYGQAPSQTGIVYVATCKSATAPGDIVRLDLKDGTSTTVTSYDGDRTVSFEHTGPDFAVWRASKTTTTNGVTRTETALVFHDARRGPPKSVDTKLLTPGASSGPRVHFAAYAGEGRALVAWEVGYKSVRVGVLDVDGGGLVWKTPNISTTDVEYVATADRSRFLVHWPYGDSSLGPLVIDNVTTQPSATALDTRLRRGLPWSFEGEWAFFDGKRVLMRHSTEGWTLVDLDSQERTPIGDVRYSNGNPAPPPTAADDGSLAVATRDGEQGFLRLVPPGGSASAPIPLGPNTWKIAYVAPNASFALVHERKPEGGTEVPKLLSFVPGRPPEVLLEGNIDTLRAEKSESGPPFVIARMYSPTRTLVAPIDPAGKLGPIVSLPYADVKLLDANHVLAGGCVVALDGGTPTDVCLNEGETLFDLQLGSRSFVGVSFGANAPAPWTYRSSRFRFVQY